jgi:excisionase family DNA binding protein
MPLNDSASQPGAANIEEFRLVTSDDLARRYNVSRRTVQSWAKNGVLPAVRISERCLRFDPRKCDKALGKYEV